MDNEYLLRQWVWTDADLDVMGWHDATLHAIAIEGDSYEFALDIDYIFEWAQEADPAAGVTFWVAPCTLVFENVVGLELDLSPHNGLHIDSLSRTDAGAPRNAGHIGKAIDWKWTIDCLVGSIVFRSTGFFQYARMAPKRGRQRLRLEERGGLSFQRGRLIE